MSENLTRIQSFAELQQEVTRAQQSKKAEAKIVEFLRPGEEIAAVEAVICPECGGSVAKGSRTCVSCHTDLYVTAQGEVGKMDSAVEAARLREQRLPAHMVDMITKMPVNVGDLVMLSYYYFIPYELSEAEEQISAKWHEARSLAEPFEDRASKDLEMVRRLEGDEKGASGDVAKLRARAEASATEAKAIMDEIEPERAEWLATLMNSGRKARILPIVSVTEPESALMAGIIKSRNRVAGHYKPYRLHKVNGHPFAGLCLSSGKVDEKGAAYSEFEFYEERRESVSMGRVWRQFELRTGTSLVERRKDYNERHHQLDRNARPELITTSRGHTRSDNKLINQASRPEDGIGGEEDLGAPLVAPLTGVRDPEVGFEQEHTKRGQKTIKTAKADKTLVLAGEREI